MTGGAQDIIRVEGVWRRYRRWKQRPATLKEAFVRALQRGGLAYEDFWALRDVSFSVGRGEIVGFCGHNGSGKSTLLKTLARIIRPTYGRIAVRGKIATLLEVATGFHPQMTGRENIVINGALMGFTEREIAAKTDSIVEFAGLGEFIDNPVKTYSAGMYMRLGFAVASHVDADILLIDEVLAVGDAEFQKKCARWLEELRRRRVTVLLVSHDLYVLAQTCDRVVWLDHGSIKAMGAPRATLKQYCPDLIFASEPAATAAAAMAGGSE